MTHIRGNTQQCVQLQSDIFHMSGLVFENAHQIKITISSFCRGFLLHNPCFICSKTCCSVDFSNINYMLMLGKNLCLAKKPLKNLRWCK